MKPLEGQIVRLTRAERRLFGVEYEQMHIAMLGIMPLFDGLAREQADLDQYASQSMVVESVDYVLSTRADALRRRRDLLVPFAAMLLMYEIEKDLP